MARPLQKLIQPELTGLLLIKSFQNLLPPMLKKGIFAFSLTLLTVATVSDPLLKGVWLSSVLAQSSTPPFSLPDVVPKGSTVRINGSTSMETINQALKQQFETKYPGTAVKAKYTGTRAALRDLLAGKVDLAAIGRPLTDAEKAQGLVAVPVARHKIAAIVGSGNAFKGSLSDQQFAKIFRGEITNWSQVGGSSGPIKFVDRAEDSDTRQSFRNYPVFKKAKFAAAPTATKLTDDSTTTVIQSLGTNGIGYAIADQVVDNAEARIVKMHQVLPNDRRYPFSQPLVYVYKGTPTPGAAAWLGYATAPVNQQAIEKARVAGAIALATGAASLAGTASPDAATSTSAPVSPTATPASASPNPTIDVAAVPDGDTQAEGLPVWLWLLPLAALGLLAWWALRRRSTPTVSDAPPVVDAPTDSVPPIGDAAVNAISPITPPSVGAVPIADGPVEESLPAVSDVVVTPAAINTPQAVDTGAAVESSTGAPSISGAAVADAAGMAATGAGAAALAGLAAGSQTSSINRAQSDVEATKFDVGQTVQAELASIDEGLSELPDGYGESRIVLMPRDPQWAYAYWDAPNDRKEELRNQGGQRLALRLYDVTDIDLNHESPHSLQQYDCEEMARDWYVPIPVSDRDYVTEIGYVTGDGNWLLLARSNAIRIPPIYPSAWFEDQFITVAWHEELKGKTLFNLAPPSQRQAFSEPESTPIYDSIFGMTRSAEAMRVAGSLFGSMQQVPSQAVNAIFPSGVGLGVPTLSGITMSGIGMSGIGMSGIGAAMPPIRSRKFWLIADAELIVYGATEPDATVTINGRPIQLNPDGTFRFQMSFQDGVLNFPIVAVAADGEQTRSIQMDFNRTTPYRHTNTQDEAVDDFF